MKRENSGKTTVSDRRTKLNSLISERVKISESMSIDHVIRANLAVINVMKESGVPKEELKALQWNVPVRLLDTEYFSLLSVPTDITNRKVSQLRIFRK